MVLGGYGNGKYERRIWYSEYHGPHQIEYEWKRFSVGLPRAGDVIGCVVLDCLLIISISGGDCCWILDLDLDSDKYKWSQPKVGNIKMNLQSIIVTNDNNLYFIDQYSSSYEQIHLFEFLPDEIYQKYHQRNLN